MLIETDTLRFSDAQIVARTLWAEARGLGLLGERASACTIMNRASSGVTWWGHSYRQICLFPEQYSCWNPNDPNRPKMFAINEQTDDSYAIAKGVADALINGELNDVTNGATHYFNHHMPAIAWPSWAASHEMIFDFEPHWFYRVVD